MQQSFKLVIDFLLAVMCSYILASLFHTQIILYELSKIGVVINFQTRLSTSVDDMLGLLPAYGSAIAVALLLGFLVVKLISVLSKRQVNYLYPIAGAVAILSALMIMHPILDITLIAGAREPLGIALQGLAGLFGGWAFMHQRNPKVHKH
ncbi:hypothetical protein [Aliiglaciecola sp. LCG003]|uniref:hypothetical protein n=1 Tax=Aliiglaciecola sp. LCG003 TaxID=3053655 RepID=UPI002573F7D7|nr:hypothetical protein [Aliiglaciecola sp. LCG003]WJG10174.1 hypothetical protein QR722_03840 [Aliiglaciecola sp. LCG003]